MILVKKLNFFHILCLSKIDLEKVFPDVLHKKDAFQDHKNNSLWKTQTKNFSKGVRPSLWSNIKDFFNFDFYAKSTKKKYLGTFYLEKSFYSSL